MPPPSRSDLSGFGKLINNHYRHKFVDTESIEVGVRLSGAGFTLQQERGQKIVVVFYPDTPQFIAAMTHEADRYYEIKNRPKIPPPQPKNKPKRKRIKPEYSAKPGNGISRTY